MAIGLTTDHLRLHFRPPRKMAQGRTSLVKVTVNPPYQSGIRHAQRKASAAEAGAVSA
jgi:hypothetical protein